jgi:hypothetical protein
MRDTSCPFCCARMDGRACWTQVARCWVPLKERSTRLASWFWNRATRWLHTRTAYSNAAILQTKSSEWIGLLRRSEKQNGNRRMTR